MKSKHLNTRKNTTKKHKRGGKKDCHKTCKKNTIKTVKKTEIYKKVTNVLKKMGLKEKYDQKIEEGIDQKNNPHVNALMDLCEKNCKKTK